MRVVQDELSIGAVADGRANGLSGEIGPARDRKVARADNRRFGSVVVRPDKAHLPITLHVVAHRRDRQIDLVIRQHRNARCGLHLLEIDRDAESTGNRSRDIDLVPMPLVAADHAELRIIFAHSNANPACAEDPHEPIDAGPGAFGGDGGSRLRQQPVKRGVRQFLRARSAGSRGGNGCSKQQRRGDGADRREDRR